jgi:hypothetical protein
VGADFFPGSFSGIFVTELFRTEFLGAILRRAGVVVPGSFLELSVRFSVGGVAGFGIRFGKFRFGVRTVGQSAGTCESSADECSNNELAAVGADAAIYALRHSAADGGSGSISGAGESRSEAATTRTRGCQRAGR